MWGCRGWGWGWQAAGTGVSVSREMVGFTAPSKKPARELKSPRAPKFEQKPATFVPIELLSV